MSPNSAQAWAIIRTVTGDKRLASAIAIAIVSHIILDIVQHEPDIRLFPVSWGLRLAERYIRSPMPWLKPRTVCSVGGCNLDHHRPGAVSRELDRGLDGRYVAAVVIYVLPAPGLVALLQRRRRALAGQQT
jgi:hypothetical protein